MTRTLHDERAEKIGNAVAFAFFAGDPSPQEAAKIIIAADPYTAEVERLTQERDRWKQAAGEHAGRYWEARYRDEAADNQRLTGLLADSEKVLLAVQSFIRNGVALGFVRMPDAESNDPALKTPGMVNAMLSLISQS